MRLWSRGRVSALLGAFVVALCVAGTAVAQSGEDEEALLTLSRETWSGDLDGIVERGFLRMATAYNPLFFSYDGIERSGILYDIALELEKYLNEKHAPKGKKIAVVIMPMPRDQILPSVIEGRADVAAANLTITPERAEQVAFSEPTYKEVSELVITGPAAPSIASFDDLVETEIHVRESSSYFEHLTALNAKREADGKGAIPIEAADERLEDYDLLEMVESGILPAVIVDSHKAALWSQIFENITVHEELAVNSGGEIAWVVRQDSPELLAAVNTFVDTIRKGSMVGNVLIKRHFGGKTWVDNVTRGDARSRYEDTVDIIKAFSEKYDFDWLMITAQAYQESRLDQSKRSHAGAVGIMQVLPTTAADPNVGIPDINDPENNVHAGVKYLRFLREQYFDDPEIEPVDQILLSFGAYNAGPGNISKARKRAVKMGLDPNKWFGNVEVAAGRAISREPVIYVRNIYKYYVAYKHMEEARLERAQAVDAAAQ